MQPILKTTDYSNLYHFLIAMQLVTQDANSADSTTALESVFIWSPEACSTLLDSSAKLEIVSRYAGRLKVRLVLSAAADKNLRRWAQNLGWTVLWTIPGLDDLAYEKLSSPEPLEYLAS